MFIKYDEYELIELFWEEAKKIDAEAGLFEYKKEDNFGFKFSMYMSAFEQFCSITLFFKDYEKPIYDIGFKGVKQIESKNNKLIIRQNKEEHDVAVYFKPNFALVYEKNS